jgi:AAA+ ATPase superfamily predicted ATPase
MKIIGRQNEQQLLTEYVESGVPEFVAVYGRRRVGKTYLINEFFREEYAFQVTGLIRASRPEQLRNFHAALRKYGSNLEQPPKNWFDAFEALISLLERKRNAGPTSTSAATGHLANRAGNGPARGRLIVFLDELPWFDTRKSGFITALGHFWNGWAASKPEVLLVACGSATSWMVNKLIKDRGGLHNRVTQRMRLAPFNLKETEEYLNYKDILWGRREIAETYMILGGIPFYLNQLRRGASLAQNIDRLCFDRDAFMRDEFTTLFASLFDDYEKHIKVLEALSKNGSGLTRDDIIAAAKIKSGGTLTKVLDELEQCGFIACYNDYSAKAGLYVYQLADFFVSFYYQHMRNNRHLGIGWWSKNLGKGAYNNWVGHSFERLCLTHIDRILACLGISGIVASPFAWKSACAEPGKRAAQIDLLIDRVDGIINICECKFCNDEYVIERDEAERLRARVSSFVRETRTRKACHLTMITAYGVKANKYSSEVRSEVVLDDLFGA